MYIILFAYASDYVHYFTTLLLGRAESSTEYVY